MSLMAPPEQGVGVRPVSLVFDQCVDLAAKLVEAFSWN